MIKEVYISCPISVDQSILDSFYDELYEIDNINPIYWERGGTYDPSMLEEAHACVFILPDNKFSAIGYELPAGVKKELARAYALGKRIYVGYIGKKAQVYSAITNGVDIKGVAGTFKEILNFANNNVVKPSIMPPPPIHSYKLPEPTRYSEETLDRRLLLMQ